MRQTPPIDVREILSDFCGHHVPGWLPFECHVALVQIGAHTGLYLDGNLIIGEETYLKDTAQRYIAVMIGEPCVRRQL